MNEERMTYWNEELDSYLLKPEYFGGNDLTKCDLINKIGLLEDEVEWNASNNKTGTRIK